jgi:hypothetical protein
VHPEFEPGAWNYERVSHSYWQIRFEQKEYDNIHTREYLDRILAIFQNLGIQLQDSFLSDINLCLCIFYQSVLVTWRQCHLTGSDGACRPAALA